MPNTNKSLNKMIKIAILGALAAILMCFEIPFPTTTWLKIDFGDLPVLLGGFAFGPIAAVVIQAIKIIIKVLIVGSSSGVVGEFANFIIGLFFVIPATIIYRKMKSAKGAIIGMIVGILFMEIAAIFTNYFVLLPAFGMKLSVKEFTNYVLIGLLPVNTIKAVVVSVVTLISYNKLAKTIFKVDNYIK